MNRQRFLKNYFLFLLLTFPCFLPLSWAQAGQKALLQLNVNGWIDLAVFDVETQTVKNLTNTPKAHEIGLDWSPDGQKILFLSGGKPDEDDKLEVINADGNNRRILIKIKPGEFEGANWFPFGGKLVLSFKKADNFDIYTLQTNNNDLQRLIEHPAEDLLPVWSPDGSRIAFISNREKGKQLYVMNAGGENLTQLTRNLGDVSSIFWSPDGSRIAFLSGPKQERQLYVVDADGENLILLSDDFKGVGFSVAWSPDGTQLAFHGGPGIFIVDANRKDKPKPLITPGLNSHGQPIHWLPDGRILLHSFDGVFTMEMKGKQDMVEGKDITLLFKNPLEQAPVVNGLVQSWFDPAFIKLAVHPQQKKLVVLGSIKAAMLRQNYPNPFNPETWMPFELRVDGFVTIQIHDLKGRRIRTLSLGHLPTGVYLSKSKAGYWDGRDEAGQPVASGVYFYTLQVERSEDPDLIGVGEFSETRRMLVVK